MSKANIKKHCKTLLFYLSNDMNKRRDISYSYTEIFNIIKM